MLLRNCLSTDFLYENWLYKKQTWMAFVFSHSKIVQSIGMMTSYPKCMVNLPQLLFVWNDIKSEEVRIWNGSCFQEKRWNPSCDLASGSNLMLKMWYNFELSIRMIIEYCLSCVLELCSQELSKQIYSLGQWYTAYIFKSGSLMSYWVIDDNEWLLHILIFLHNFNYLVL